MRIFVSYRREDAGSEAGRLADALRNRYRHEDVFFDVDTIRIGSPFNDEIVRAIVSSDVLIAVIGRGWVNAAAGPEGARRLDDSNDYVRREIETALDAGVVVIPVCVQGAGIPNPRGLPEPLAPMTERQGFELRENSWHNDVAGLIRRLDGTEDDAHRPRTRASSGSALIWGLVRKLPPLDREARPGVAALLSAVLPGIGTALYFRTLADVLISTIFAVPFLVLTSTLPEQGSPSEGQQAWWSWVAWGVLAALSRGLRHPAFVQLEPAARGRGSEN